jgi:Domain of unknown function (DUF4326)
MITVVRRGQPLRKGVIRFSVGRASSGVGRLCIPAHALGNPTKLHREADREKSIESYKTWLTEQIETKDKAVCHALNQIFLAAKRGEVELECFCHPKACHADVIKHVVEEKLRNVQEAP